MIWLRFFLTLATGGIKITAGSTYTASFYYRFPTSSSFTGSVVVGLQTTSGQALGSATASISGSQTSWKQVTVSITPSATPSSTSNLFTITFDGAAASGQNINFAMLSLFPPTFKNRVNGMRQDLAQALADIGPAFFRFPGGNNLEGQTVASRWQWNTTVNFYRYFSLFISHFDEFGVLLGWSFNQQTRTSR